MLLVFLKDAAHRAQRANEYRFAVWAEDEPAEDVLDLDVSPALADAMSRPRPKPDNSGFMRVGAAEYSAVEDAAGDGPSGPPGRVETLPAFRGAGNPTVVLRPHDDGTLPADLRETAATSALLAPFAGSGREDGGRMQAGRCRRSVARRADPAVPLCDVRRVHCRRARERRRLHRDYRRTRRRRAGRDEDRRGGRTERVACRISSGDTHLASTAPDPLAFERLLESRLAEVGVKGQDDAGCG